MGDEPFGFTCPRCHAETAERFYGPCATCRELLVSEQRVTASETSGHSPSGGERARFEPSLNVVPNHVATKD